MSESLKAPLKKGDCVFLKSGGPKMTIELIEKKYEFSKDLTAWCKWFDGTKLKTDTFDVEVLTVEVKVVDV